MSDLSAKEVAGVLSQFVNSYSNDMNDVVDCLAHDHRTLQQGFTRFSVKWLERCAKMHDEGNFDLRNQASCELGKVFVSRVNTAERALPFI